jgi:hypothetical protein
MPAGGIPSRKQKAERPQEVVRPAKTICTARYFFGAAGALVAGGEDMSPLSLQATKKVALIKARNR